MQKREIGFADLQVVDLTKISLLQPVCIMKTLKSWSLKRSSAQGVELALPGGHVLRVLALDESLFRVSLKKKDVWRLGQTWSIAPEGSTAWEGRSRDDLSGFVCPSVLIEEGASLTLSTSQIRLTISDPLHLSWAAKIDGQWVTFAEERPTGGTMLGVDDHAHAHFLRRNRDEPVYGLGEKAGDLNRAGRRFEMRNLDALGYDAETTDPLYKHFPFTMTKTAAAGYWSIFYDNLASCWFDLGNELDNYHLPYRAYRAEDGDLDYYLRWAPDMLDLVKGQVAMTGGTYFQPRWALGYSGSTMSYTDAPDAQVQVSSFLTELERHDIPCDSFQMSSGYSSINGKRYVFNWNTDKFPDIKAMSAKFEEAGVHLVANIKPCMLHDHPKYAEAASAGLFVKDSETGEPEQSSFWDDWGSNLDFTNSKTIAWWKQGVTQQLLEKGIGSTWNDNNEYEIWDRKAQCAGFGEPKDIALIRPLHSLLMTRASFEAQSAHKPGQRPYLICRSGTPGVQRYAQTWSGDNRTNWKTLKYNIRMGLGMSLSGLFNIGHDVGGFAGPKPDPELFVRWVQNGIFHPRFTIHSWNDDGTANEPWMYPQVLPLVRQAIALRYALMPYLYTLLWRAADQHEPMIRPLFLDHAHDPRCWEESDDFMVGSDLLVASVVEPGAAQRQVYLPDNGTGWWDYETGQWYAPGQDLILPVTLETIPLFVRAGALIPMSPGIKRVAANATSKLAIFPTQGPGSGQGQLFEDDGLSIGADHRLFDFQLVSSTDILSLDWTSTGTLSEQTAGIEAGSLEFSLPKTETRRLVVKGLVI